jgi:hypothetical protein
LAELRGSLVLSQFCFTLEKRCLTPEKLCVPGLVFRGTLYSPANLFTYCLLFSKVLVGLVFIIEVPTEDFFDLLDRHGGKSSMDSLYRVPRFHPMDYSVKRHS